MKRRGMGVRQPAERGNSEVKPPRRRVILTFTVTPETAAGILLFLSVTLSVYYTQS